ncbi:MAG: molybdopterin-dependent oxidoreductase [bacterium]|nr:molybdopterin-dependent oxidoreductase [bacterium]
MNDVAQVDPSVSKTPLPLDAKGLSTVCVLCSHNCGIQIDVKGGKIEKVRADETNPISKGYICNKGFSVARYAHHEQRTQHPLRRRADGSFERIDWDTAIREIGEKLSTIREEHSPRAIALAGVGGQANHMDGNYALSFLSGLGSPWWFNALGQEKTQHFLVDQWMFDSPPQNWFHPDIENTKLLLALGTNPRISNRGHNANDTFKRFSENPDQRMIVVDPRETETTRQADRHLKTKPGSDAFLLLGIAATLTTSEGLADAAFIQAHTRDFDVLQKSLAEVDVAEMAERSGITLDELQGVTQELASSDSAAIMFDLAVEQLPHSTLISYLIRVISSLTGNAVQPGGNLFMETQAPPEWSPKRWAPLPATREAGIRGIAAIGGFPMYSPTLLSEEITVDHPERIRGLIVEGANPILSYSDANAFREARKQLDLLVVIDPAMTETALLADYVLPTPCGYEKWETSGFPRSSSSVFLQLRPPIIPGPEEALPEPEIYVRLAEAMGLVREVPAELCELAPAGTTAEGAAAIFGKVQELATSRTEILFWGYRSLGAELAAPSLIAIWVTALQNAFGRRDSVVRSFGETWKDVGPFELAMEIYRRVLEHPEGVEIARTVPAGEAFDACVGWEDKKIRLAPEDMLPEIARAIDTPLPTDPEYPMVLASGLRTRWNCNTVQRDPKWRKGRGPHCSLHLAPADAARLGIEEGEQVRLATKRGAVELPAAVDDRLQAGHVWVPNGFGMAYPSGPGGELEVQGANLNEISDAADRDPITGCPHHKYTLCRVEKAAA